MKRILVTPRSLTRDGDPALDDLAAAGFEVVFCTPGRQPDEAELLRLLPGCVGYLAGVEPISARVLKAATGLKAISRNGTGVDNIDLEAAGELGITVLRAEGANARGVAELAIALMLAAGRFIAPSDQAMKAGQWKRIKGAEVQGRTLGLVGCGQIGRMVARMALGLEMEVIAYDLYPNEEFRPSPRFRFAALEEVLAQADVISLHAPAPRGGKPVIDIEALRQMKHGAFVINTARAALVDGAAVLEALESGHLAGYATDVYDQEPPEADDLLRHERVIATPHIGGYTAQSVERATTAAVENLLRTLEE